MSIFAHLYLIKYNKVQVDKIMNYKNVFNEYQFDRKECIENIFLNLDIIKSCKLMVYYQTDVV